MDLAPEIVDELQKRLRRVEGQVRGIQAMITDGRDCSAVVTQFSAAAKALDHAAYKFLAATMAYCADHPDEAEAEGYSPERLEKLFMRLA